MPPLRPTDQLHIHVLFKKYSFHPPSYISEVLLNINFTPGVHKSNSIAKVFENCSYSGFCLVFSSINSKMKERRVGLGELSWVCTLTHDWLEIQISRICLLGWLVAALFVILGKRLQPFIHESNQSEILQRIEIRPTTYWTKKNRLKAFNQILCSNFCTCESEK